MASQEQKNISWLEIVENIERVLFYTSLLFLPLSILPLPWDLTEYSMGFTLLLFACVILTIEMVKLVWKGRLLVPKTFVDTGLLLFLSSIILSTVFSISPVTSLWGFDFRLGSGLILTLITFVYLYSVRSFLFNSEEVGNGLKFLIVGTFLTALFSIISFFGMNILAFSQTFDTLFTAGLPAYSSSRISAVIWSISFLISVYFSAVSFNGKKLPYAVFYIISGAVHLLAISLFTLAQGWEIFALIGIVLLIFAVIVGIKGNLKLSKSLNLILYVFTTLTILIFVLTRIPAIRNGVGSIPQSLITQITVSNDTSLKIVTQSLSQKVSRSIVGMGNDTFSIAYNQFKPLADETLIINSTNFTNANNQIFNILSNRGLLGFGAFIFLGYLLFKYVYSNFKANRFSSEDELMFFLLDLLTIFLFITNFFIYQTFFLTFLLVYLVSSSVSIRNIIFKDKLEVYVFNWGIFTHTSGNVGMRNMAMGVSVVFVLIGCVAFVYTSRLGMSAHYALQAEKLTAQGREKTEEKKLGEEEKSRILVDSINLYSKAINLNNGNDVLHRRAAIILSQYLESLASSYNKTDDEASKKKLFDQIATYVEISVEESKRATDIAPRVYANWGVRGSVYSKLVGLGLNSYTKSALTALQTAATLNPLNYEIYYNAAQLYILNNESDNALRTLNQLFSINSNHIPSLILAGEISAKDKDFKQAQRYFLDAKKVMEGTNSTSNEIYDYVNKKLGEITPQIESQPQNIVETPQDEVQK